MHEVIVATLFLAMLAVPCFVTMTGESSEDTLSMIVERAGAGELTASK